MEEPPKDTAAHPNPYVDAKGHFVKGNPGKPRGANAKRTREGEAFARAWCDANQAAILDEITTHGDLDQKLRAFQFLFEHAHGKPTQRVDVDLEGLAREWAARAGEAVTPEELLSTAQAMVGILN